MPTMTSREISKLSVAERILLVEKIWECIPPASEDLALSPEQLNELDARIDSYRSGKERTTTWPILKASLRARRACR